MFSISELSLHVFDGWLEKLKLVHIEYDLKHDQSIKLMFKIEKVLFALKINLLIEGCVLSHKPISNVN
ncbi:CLUMA_CG004061, isoform A [Clunio marinus]|uniref:CLUMA_CG004061, isoform A n=1 Tax=Clunio marinus TaxID=568069 RepID=A0A1J1HSE9_9DIPT|nr:CLUMA_CG004061, isoform A [Clunio marinus]